MKFFLLILKNLGRSKLRTTLTALAVTVMVTICAEMTTIIVSVRQHVAAESSQSKLLVTRALGGAQPHPRSLFAVADAPRRRDGLDDVEFLRRLLRRFAAAQSSGLRIGHAPG